MSLKNKIWLELGTRWTARSLDELMTKVSRIPSAGDRVIEVVRAFRGIPFFCESLLADPPNACIRVRLETMDCATLVYNAIAIANSRTIDDIAVHLARIRYLDPDNSELNSDPSEGTMLGLASDAILKQSIWMGYLANVTTEIAEPRCRLKVARIDLQPQRRPRWLDREERVERPLLGSGPQIQYYLPKSAFENAKWELIRNGDVIVFTRGSKLADGTSNYDFVNHLAIAEMAGNEAYFIHSTRHFAWRPLASAEATSSWTGVFYDEDKKKEQIGVGPGGIYAGEQVSVLIGGERMHGYDMSRRRTLADYAASNFDGVIILRPQDLTVA